MIIAGSVQFYLLLRAQDEQESFNAWEGFFKERKNSFFHKWRPIYIHAQAALC